MDTPQILVCNTVYKRLQNSVYDTTCKDAGFNSVVVPASQIACPIDKRERTYQP